MNYKALALCLLLALPVGLVAMPIHNVQALTTPEMFVVPIIKEFDGPCVKGTTFTVDVWLFNMEMTAAGDVYAFDFNLDWSSIVGDGGLPLIALVNNSITIHSPWPSGGYFMVDNATYSATYPESGPRPNQATNNQTNYPQFLITGYHLAITAMPPKGTGLWDVNQSVVTLTFHVEKDVCWPYGYDFKNGFKLTLNSISGDGTTVIPLAPITQNGEYSQIPFQPNIDLVDSDAVVNSTMALITEKCVSHETDVEVDLTNITNVYGFGFNMTFPYLSCLEPDLQKITIKAAFPPPYDVLLVTNGTNGAWGWVQVIVIKPSEKPTVCGADVPAVDVVFHTIDIADVPPQLPSKSIDPIRIDSAFVLTKGCTCGTFEYDYGKPTVPAGYAGNTIWSNPTGVPFDGVHCNTWGLIYGLYYWTTFGVYAPLPWSNGWLYYSPTYTLQYNDITYYFKSSPYDLNLDCVVDVQDMKMLVPYYGKTTCPGGYGDIFNDGAHLVDIYDFVAIAKHAGPIDP